MFLKKKVIATIIALVLVVGVLSAEAGVNFGGTTGLGGGSVISSGKVGGCGNQGCASVSMHVTGSNLTAWCQNNGGKIAPGQNTLTVDSNFSTSLTIDSNGNYDFYMEEEILPTVLEAGCPNGNWTVVDLTGPITVTLSAFATGETQPAATLTFACEAVFGVATQCTEIN
ncbi:MAG: hypothetical protein L0154_26330 [Chloroflexi bacterium]|nr:hypothetical protein [Chloroflexota bacterium]